MVGYQVAADEAVVHALRTVGRDGSSLAPYYGTFKIRDHGSLATNREPCFTGFHVRLWTGDRALCGFLINHVAHFQLLGLAPQQSISSLYNRPDFWPRRDSRSGPRDAVHVLVVQRVSLAPGTSTRLNARRAYALTRQRITL